MLRAHPAIYAICSNLELKNTDKSLLAGVKDHLTLTFLWDGLLSRNNFVGRKIGGIRTKIAAFKNFL